MTLRICHNKTISTKLLDCVKQKNAAPKEHLSHQLIDICLQDTQ